jgi:uncharacterized protein
VGVRRPEDAADFLSSAEPLLLGDEARHNLILGIAGTIRDHPPLFPDYRLWLLEDSGGVVGAALQTPPFNLIVARPLDGARIGELADAIREDGARLPGVTGSVPEVDAFAAAWEERAPVRRRLRMAQRIFRLTEVRPVAGVSGRPRPATHDDRALLVEWVRAFADEAVGESPAPASNAERTVDARLSEGTGGFLLWENGEAVSLAGWGGLTPNGVRIGPVYTPPEHRGRGYGSAVTAAVSAAQLAGGRTFCFLYTDVANPTANRIYTNIGYEPVCDSLDYAFDTA